MSPARSHGGQDHLNQTLQGHLASQPMKLGITLASDSQLIGLSNPTKQRKIRNSVMRNWLRLGTNHGVDLLGSHQLHRYCFKSKRMRIRLIQILREILSRKIKGAFNHMPRPKHNPGWLAPLAIGTNTLTSRRIGKRPGEADIGFIRSLIGPHR